MVDAGEVDFCARQFCYLINQGRKEEEAARTLTKDSAPRVKAMDLLQRERNPGAAWFYRTNGFGHCGNNKLFPTGRTLIGAPQVKVSGHRHRYRAGVGGGGVPMVVDSKSSKRWP